MARRWRAYQVGVPVATAGRAETGAEREHRRGHEQARLLVPTTRAPASAAVTISIAISAPLPIVSTPTKKYQRADQQRLICASRLPLRNCPESVNARKIANTARPIMRAVAGVGTSATAPATTPKPTTSVFDRNAPVSWAARSRSASAGESFPFFQKLGVSSVIFHDSPHPPGSWDQFSFRLRRDPISVATAKL